MDPRVAMSHSSFAGCSTCFQQARLRSAPSGRSHVQVQAVKVKAPKDATFAKESRIGKAPIKLPAGVTVKFDSDLLEVKVRTRAHDRLQSPISDFVSLHLSIIRQHTPHAVCRPLHSPATWNALD